MKVCNVCQIEKPLDDFPLGKPRVDGTRGREGKCRDCKREATRASKERYYEKNKELCKQRSRDWNKDNKEQKAETGRKWREENKESIAQKKREYNATDRGKEVAYAQTVRQRAKEEEKPKLLARNAVSNALRSGKLIKPDCCDLCGTRIEDPKNLHGHHEDYNKQLEVIWVCVPCHKEKHMV